MTPASPERAEELPCPAKLWHGPGHQSQTSCRLPAGHDGLHEAVYGEYRQFAEWRSGQWRRETIAEGFDVPDYINDLDACTGINDEPPEEAPRG